VCVTGLTANPKFVRVKCGLGIVGQVCARAASRRRESNAEKANRYHGAAARMSDQIQSAISLLKQRGIMRASELEEVMTPTLTAYREKAEPCRIERLKRVAAQLHARPSH
jgi:hypothetical protein